MNFLTNGKSAQNINKDLWANFVSSLPAGNYFQHPDFLELFSESSKYEPITVWALNDSGQIIGVISGIIYREYLGLLGRLSSRLIITGGPLVIPGEINLTGPLLRKLEDIISKKVIYTQFRNIFSCKGLEKHFLNQGYYFEKHLNIIVDLTKKKEELWDEVNTKRRNEIRRAEKTGTTVKKLSVVFELKDSYKILCEVYSRAKLPLLEYEIFLNAFIKSKNSKGFIAFGAYNSGILIGTMYTLCYNGTIYDWYAGSIQKYYDKYPNDIIPWEVFLWGKENGFSKFDFGGAGKPDVPYGVREYKKKFGGEMVSYGRYEKIHKPVLMKLAKIGFQIKQRLNI